MTVLKYTHKINEGFISILDDICIEIINRNYKGWFCHDCSINTFNGNHNYYMVQDKLWEKHGPKEGMLCITCLEKRIGRKLEFEDFTTCILNRQNSHVRGLLIKKWKRTIPGFGSSDELVSGTYRVS